MGEEADVRMGAGSRVQLMTGERVGLGRGLGGNLEKGVARGGRELEGWGRRGGC